MYSHVWNPRPCPSAVRTAVEDITNPHPAGVLIESVALKDIPTPMPVA